MLFITHISITLREYGYSIDDMIACLIHIYLFIETHIVIR